jgi:hypothetical protein
MTASSRHRLSRTWLVLVILTLASIALTHAGPAPLVVGAGVLGGAAAKAWWIVLDFLDLRHGPVGWRALFATWILLIAVGAWAGAALSHLLT